MPKPLTDELLKVIERDAKSAIEQHRGYMDPSEIVLLIAEIRRLEADLWKLRKVGGQVIHDMGSKATDLQLNVESLEAENADLRKSKQMFIDDARELTICNNELSDRHIKRQA